eukprot:2342165-Pyramimonas_sp.AAC.1
MSIYYRVVVDAELGLHPVVEIVTCPFCMLSDGVSVSSRPCALVVMLSLLRASLELVDARQAPWYGSLSS